MEVGIIIKNGVIVAGIVAVIFLSQQSYLKNTVKNFNFPLFKKGEAFYDNSYIAKANDWLNANVYSKISGGVADKQSTLQDETNTQKNNLEKNSFDTAKKYVASKLLNALGVTPQELQPAGCPK